MTAYVFPDNTVLCNFACVDRLDLLESVLRDRGRWTDAVSHEAAQSAKWLPALRGIADGGWLGEPIEVLDERAVQVVEAIRTGPFGGGKHRPLQHLGESQTCYLLKHWPEFSGSWWVSDDKDALHFARGQGLITRETCDLVAEAVVGGDLTGTAGLALLQEMVQKGQHPRVPASVAELTR